MLNIVEVSLVRALGSRCGMKRIERKGLSVLLYPEKPDLYKLTALAAGAKGRVLLNMGNVPYASLRCRREEELADDTVSALMRYLSFDREGSGADGTPAEKA